MIEGSSASLEDGELSFAPEDQGLSEPKIKKRVLVVDDDEDVHAITDLVLRKADLGVELDVHHAYSGAECMEKLSANAPFDLVLLDVVMEDDDAGFRVARSIRMRHVVKKQPKLIIRSGQAGIYGAGNLLKGVKLDGFYEKTELNSKLLIKIIVDALEGDS